MTHPLDAQFDLAGDVLDYLKDRNVTAGDALVALALATGLALNLNTEDGDDEMRSLGVVLSTIIAQVKLVKLESERPKPASH